jgi:hypothetical protein
MSHLSRQLHHSWQHVRYGGRLPDFLVIGTQKGGTTSLHQLLSMHQQVYLPAVKEVHYFTKHADESVQWYARFFADARADQWCGDITPYYLFHPYAAPRIQALLPHVPMVVLLRDPVERALSQYFMEQRRGDEPLTLRDALAAEPERLRHSTTAIATPGVIDTHHMVHSYVSRSRYDEQLQHYFRFFPRTQILVLKSEQFFQDPASAWHHILTFLGIPVTPLPMTLPHANAGNNESMHVSADIRALLHTSLAPTYTWLKNEYGIEWQTIPH